MFTVVEISELGVNLYSVAIDFRHQKPHYKNKNIYNGRRDISYGL